MKFLKALFFISSLLLFSSAAHTQTLEDLDNLVKQCQSYQAEKIIQQLDSKLKEDPIQYPMFLATHAYFLDKCQKKYEQANQIVKKAIALLDTKQPISNHYRIYYYAAVIAKKNGDDTAFLNYIEDAFEVKKELNETTSLDVAELYYIKGTHFSSLNQPKEALSNYQKGIRITEKINSPESKLLKIKFLSKTATVYTLREEYSKSIQQLNLAQQLIKSISVSEESLTADLASIREGIYNNLGNIYLGQRQLDKAILCYKDFIQQIKKNNILSFSDLATAHSNLAIAYYFQGSLDKAAINFEKNLEYTQKAYGKKHPKLALAYANYALFHNMRGNTEKALELTLKSLNANLKGTEITDLRTALTPIIEQYDFIDPVNAGGALKNRALMFNSLYDTSNDLQDLLAAYESIQAHAFLIEKVKNSFASEEDKLHLIGLSHLPYFTGIHLAKRLFELTSDQKYLEDAFRFAEQNKAVVLSSAMQGKLALQMGGIPESSIEEQKKLQEEIAKHEKYLLDARANKNEQEAKEIAEKLFQLREEKKNFIKKLEQNYPKYHKLKYEESIATAKAVQEFLDEETALLEYVVKDSFAYLFIITKNSIHLQEVDYWNSTQDTLKQFRELLADFSKVQDVNAYQQYLQMGHHLYKVFLGEATALFKQQSLFDVIKKLIIIPDHQLSFIPFESLLMEKRTGNSLNYESLPYLVKEFPMSYNYSASLLLEQDFYKNNTPASKGFLALAAQYNPQEDSKLANSARTRNLRSVLGDLPAARQEVAALNKALGGFLDQQAYESVFKSKAEDYQVIHLAMHGILDKEDPGFSGLVFTENRNPEEDNFLFASEISTMNLKADLVVLSACETGYGKFRQGEGVMSLARSFMFAGVPSLVVSLWQVNDASTAILMQKYYDKLRVGKDKATALQEAKLNYLKTIGEQSPQAAHPAFWAPFIQLGDTTPIQLKSSSWLSNWIWVILGGLLLLFAIILIINRRRKLSKL